VLRRTHVRARTRTHERIYTQALARTHTHMHTRMHARTRAQACAHGQAQMHRHTHKATAQSACERNTQNAHRTRLVQLQAHSQGPQQSETGMRLAVRRGSLSLCQWGCAGTGACSHCLTLSLTVSLSHTASHCLTVSHCLTLSHTVSHCLTLSHTGGNGA